MKRIAILETGRPPQALIADHGDYSAMFSRLLGEGFETETFNVQSGELPEIDDFGGAIVTGSPAGVYEDHAWLPPLEDWLRRARGRLRLVGVCFGHQVMAQAFGGRVEKAQRGWCVGLHTYDVGAGETWMQPPAERIAIPASHQDQVVEPPVGARVWARSAFTPYGGLAYGDEAISLQTHPEFSPEFTRALMETRRGRIASDLLDAAVNGLAKPNDRDLVGGWIRAFLAD